MILTVTFFLIIFVFFVVYFLKHKAYRIFALCCFPLLIGKRALLVRRVAHDCRRRGYRFSLLQNRFRTLFSHRGSPDIEVLAGDSRFRISILTTPYPECRYHFQSIEGLEVVRDVYEAVMYKGGVVRNPGESRTLACYGLDFPEPPRDVVSLVLLHPAPHDISAVHGTKTDFLGNGDVLYPSLYLRDANTLFDVLDGKAPYAVQKD